MCSKTGDNNLSATELCPLVIVLYRTVKHHQLLCRLLSCEPYRLIESAVAGQFQKSHEDLSLFIVLNFQLMKIGHAILISVSLNFCVF